MTDLVMVAIMITAIVLLAAYVAFCDRIVTSDDDDRSAPAERASTDSEVTA